MHIKKYISIVFLLIAVAAVQPAMAQSKSKKQLEKEKTQLEAEIKKLNADLAKAKKNTKLTNSQLAALNKNKADDPRKDYCYAYAMYKLYNKGGGKGSLEPYVLYEYKG